jgi:hypothetical protein
MTGAAPPVEFTRESWTGERRVTCDLDDADPLEVVRAMAGLEAAGAHDVEARVSASGDGAHVRAWFDAEDVDAADVETLRLAHGDHPRRTYMDREHSHKPQQVLFTSKGDAEAGPWRRDPWLVVDELKRRADHL